MAEGWSNTCCWPLFERNWDKHQRTISDLTWVQRAAKHFTFLGTCMLPERCSICMVQFPPSLLSPHFLQESIFILPHIVLHLLPFTTYKFLHPTRETLLMKLISDRASFISLFAITQSRQSSVLLTTAGRREDTQSEGWSQIPRAIFCRRSANDVSVMDDHIGALVAPSSRPHGALLMRNLSKMIWHRLMGERNHIIWQMWSTPI